MQNVITAVRSVPSIPVMVGGQYSIERAWDENYIATATFSGGIRMIVVPECMLEFIFDPKGIMKFKLMGTL